MKIEKLNDNKVKITLNIDDLEEKNIDLYSFMHNTPETQDLFWDILSEVEKECGFNVDNSMIYVEATTTDSGNFSLIVTKTNEKPSANFTKTLNDTFKRKNYKLKRKTISLDLKNNIFEFDTFDDICEFAKNIDAKQIEGDILYALNNKYYLICNTMPYASILEFATVSSYSNILEAKLCEYGKVVIEENALSTITKFFIKKNKKA